MTTLALNIIVGPNEANVLNRCLKSFDVNNVFDEIVIINTSNDTNIDKVAHKFTSNVYNYNWETSEFPYGNFGGAREFAKSKSTADKILWLDADDVLLEEYKDKFKKAIDLIKDDKNKDIAIWFIPYAVIVDGNGNPEMWFKRERVFDRKKIRWERAVHELMVPGAEMVQNATINGLFITHLPMKPTFLSAKRNIDILRNEYNKDKSDTQTKYFLGRDLLLSGGCDEGIELLESILSDLGTGYEMLYAIAIELAWFYAYNKNLPRPDLNHFIKRNSLKVESYCRLALAFSHLYAEPYILIGDVYWHKGEVDHAIRMYATAMKKDVNKGKMKSAPLYFEIPCIRLSSAYRCKGFDGLSLHFNCQALTKNKCEDYIKMNDEITKTIIKKNGELNCCETLEEEQCQIV